MNMIRPRNDMSVSAYSWPSQLNAPGFSRYSLMHHETGSAISSTNVTATPNPKAVLTFLDTARNEHIPKK